MKKTVYPWLDLLKLIMAVSVVAVHTNPLYGFDAPFASRVLNVLESISVPFSSLHHPSFALEDFVLRNSKIAPRLVHVARGRR